MKIYLGTDHAGFELKEKIKAFLQQEGYEAEDCGAFSFDSEDDYPDFITPVAKHVNDEVDVKGIILGGSGQAEAMLANKFPKVRCALFYGGVVPATTIDAKGTESKDPLSIIALTRIHNNANMLSIGARFVSEEEVLQAVKLWVTTPFGNEERHQRRIEKMEEIAKHL